MKKLPPVFRPRLTWRYVLCSAVVTYVAYCWLFSMPLFAHHLPKYTGQYPVGTIDIEVPAEKPRSIHDAQLKETGEPAFRLETVLFTLYYPATKVKSVHAKHYWIPKPLSLTAEGYAKFAHVSNYVTNTIFTGAIGAIVGSITIPAKVDVPLATPQMPTDKFADYEKVLPKTSDGYPVIVFSHGMASSRTDYTHYLGELASRGYVVAAIEHRDGSSPGSLVCRSDSLPSKSSHSHHHHHHPHHHRNHPCRSKSKPILHFSLSDITSPTPITPSEFKTIQLSFRQAEISETVRILQQINAGHGSQIFSQNMRHEGHDLSSWTSALDTTHMTIAGHSYGATGALSTLAHGPSSSLPFHSAIILDPGKNSGPLNNDINVPTLIVHSNSWSSTFSLFQGRPHFDVVRDIATDVNDRGVPAWFMTSLGTSHPSVTDAPLIEPMLLSWTTGAKIDVVEGVRQYVHVSEDFLAFVRNGDRKGLMRTVAEYPDYGVDNARTDERFRRFWQVHVAPKEGDL